MKKIFFITALTMSFSVLFAQNKDLGKAESYLKKSKLDKAYESIELVMQDADALKDAQTWFVRGKIYTAIAADPKFATMVVNPEEIALEAFRKMEEINMAYAIKYPQEILKLATVYANKATAFYNEKNYTQSESYFIRNIEVADIVGSFDTTAYFNAALTSSLAQDYTSAKKYYTELVNIHYNQPSIYFSLANAYLELKDKDNAIKTMELGIQRFPEDYANMVNAAGIYLRIGDDASTKKASEILETVKTKWPNDPIVYYYIGLAYQEMKLYKEAEVAYLEVLKLKPADDASKFALGMLYAQEGDNYRNIANNTPLSDTKTYDENIKLSDESYKKSAPMLEEVIVNQPNNMNALQVLKAIYQILNRKADADRISEKISHLN